MTRSKQSALAGLALVLVAAAAAALWLARGGPDGGEPAVTIGEPAEADAEPIEVEDVTLVTPRRDEIAAFDPSTVAWPLELELSLVQRGTFERREGLSPIGSGASASLRGGVYAPDGEGEEGATVTFIGGPNAGRVLTADSTGAYGASDLYGGLDVVLIRTPTGPVAMREVRLRPLTEAHLSVGFGLPASVFGMVRDVAGEPIAGAQVMLDGQETTTGEDGVFHLPRVASGKALAVIEKPGYALYREIVPITRGTVVLTDRLNFVLEPAATLEISVAEDLGARQPAELYLIPAGGQRVNTVLGQRTFPWHLVNPIEVFPGGSARVENLPDGRVELLLFHAGAVANPRQVSVKLDAGQTLHHVLHLEPGETMNGRVVREGVPVAGAKVVLEAPNRTPATLSYLGKSNSYAEEAIVAHLPPAQQSVTSGKDGRFSLTVHHGAPPAMYLSAEADDGAWVGSRVVERGETGIELELASADLTRGELQVELPGRWQALPVRVRVQGSPREPFELQPERELIVGELERGTWRLDASWNGRSLAQGRVFEIGGEEPASMRVDLPEGAIEGQTAEQRRRAGLEVETPPGPSPGAAMGGQIGRAHV